MTPKDLHDEMREEVIRDEASEHHPHPHYRFFKKAFLVGGILIVLLLFSSYALFAPVMGAVKGRLESTMVHGDVIQLKDLTILFENGTQSLLEEIFINEQLEYRHEVAVCLLGEKEDSIYRIDKIFYPEIINQDLMSVSFASCPSHTLIMLHTHPFGHCSASQTDKDTFKRKKASNEDLLMIVMCEEQRYAIYS